MFPHFFFLFRTPWGKWDQPAILGLIITETIWGLFTLLAIFREAVSAAPSRLCSIPPAAPEGWWLGIRVVSFRLTHPPAHKFTDPNTPHGHDPSGFFLHLWFPVSDKGAWAGSLTNTHQPTQPDRQMDRQTEKHLHAVSHFAFWPCHYLITCLDSLRLVSVLR